MFVVILDVKNKEIFDYTGVNSHLFLPLITEELGERLFKELKYSDINKSVIYGNVKYEGLASVNNFNELSKKILNSGASNVLLLFSNIYFEFSHNFKKIALLNLESADITDKSGNACGHIFKTSFFIELFNELNSEEMYKKIKNFKGITRIHGADYIFNIDSLLSYKQLVCTVLNKKTNITLPEVAEGIYTTGEIQKGDFVIIPPVFIGSNVQIESDCIIGPDCVITDNTLISKNTHVKSSVLLNDNYVSSGCYLENVLSCENVSVLRNSAVFSGTCLGHHSLVSEGTFLENNSKIRPFTRTGDYFQKSDEEPDLTCIFSGCTPEYASLLGSALGTLFKGKKIGVLTDGELNSHALKYALFSGMISTGIRCFDLGEGYVGSLLTLISACDLDFAVFIKGGRHGTSVSIINHFCEYISKDIILSIKDIIDKKALERATEKECFRLRKLNGLRRLYIHKILKDFKRELSVFPTFNCQNKYINSVIKDIMSKLSFETCDEQIAFYINDDGTGVVCNHKNTNISHSKLLEFVSFYSKEFDDLFVKNWRFDAVCLVFKVLYIISEFRLDLSSEINNLPVFYVAEKTVEIPVEFSKIAGKLSEKYAVNYKGAQLQFKSKGVDLKIIKNHNNKLKIVAHSMNLENSREIVGDVASFLCDI